MRPLTVPATTGMTTFQPCDEKEAGTISVLLLAIRGAVGVRCLALTLTVYRVHPELDRRHVGTGWRVRNRRIRCSQLPGKVSPTDVRMEIR